MSRVPRGSSFPIVVLLAWLASMHPGALEQGRAAGTVQAAAGVSDSSSPASAEAGRENVRSHGARGDGRTDDTAAIQKTVDAASSGAKSVFVPPGTYRTSGPGIRITGSGVALLGAGEYASILEHSGDGPAVTIGDGRNLCLDNRIAGLKIASANARSDGILLNDMAVRYNIENVTVSGFAAGKGIRAVDRNHSGHVSRVQLNENATGISIGDRGQFTDISYCKIFHNSRYGIELTDCNTINVFSTQIEKNGGSDGASVIARGVDALNLIGCYNEQNEAYPGPFLILTEGTTNGFSRAVNLLGCRAIGNRKAPCAIVLAGVHDMNVTGNSFRSFSNGIFVLRPLKAGAVRNVSGQANAFDGPMGDDPFSAK